MHSLTKAYSKYGADMGRREFKPTNQTEDHKVYLYHVRLDSGGYDQGGAYWGIGTPLYRAYNDEIDLFIRAHDRDQAKTDLLRLYPVLKFFR